MWNCLNSVLYGNVMTFFDIGVEMCFMDTSGECIHLMPKWLKIFISEYIPFCSFIIIAHRAHWTICTKNMRSRWCFHNWPAEFFWNWYEISRQAIREIALCLSLTMLVPSWPWMRIHNVLSKYWDLQRRSQNFALGALLQLRVAPFHIKSRYMQSTLLLVYIPVILFTNNIPRGF